MAQRRLALAWSVEDTGATFRRAAAKVLALALDPMVGSVNFDFMGPVQRAINLIVALVLVAIGGSGLVYFNFIDTTWPRWITVVAIIVGAAGLYWLWEEHVNLGQQPRD